MMDVITATPLVFAAEEGDLKTVKWHMEHGTDPNQVQVHYTATTMAAIGGHKEVLEVLIENGADVNKTVGPRPSALHWACIKGHANCVQLLLENKADCSVADDGSSAPVSDTMVHGNLDCFKLVHKQAALELMNSTKDKASNEEYHLRQILRHNSNGFCMAIENQHSDIVLYVLNSNFFDLERNFFYKTKSLLSLLIEHDINEAAVDILLEKRVDVNKTSSEFSKSPLMYAAERGNSKIVEKLLQRGADVNKLYKSELNPYGLVNCGLSAVYSAAVEGHANCLKIILNRKPAREAVEVSGYVAMVASMCAGSVQTLQLLLEAGLDCNKKHDFSSMCCYPISKACQLGYIDCAKLLIRHGARVNSTYKDRTPLEYCVQYEHYDVMKILLEAGASVNGCRGKQNALWYATQNGHVDVVKLLLSKGASVNTPCLDGETPIFIASNLGHTDCLKELLSARNIHVNCLNNRGCTAVIGAIRNKKLDCVSVLLQNGLNPNLNKTVGLRGKISSREWLPLIWAIKEDYTACVELLLSHGANPYLRNASDSYNAYQVSVQKNKPECLKILLEHSSMKDHTTGSTTRRSKWKILQRSIDKSRTLTSINELLLLGMRKETMSSPTCAEVLISFGACVNYRNIDGQSCLLEAARYLSIDGARVLLAHNADVFNYARMSTSRKTQNPLECAGLGYRYKEYGSAYYAAIMDSYDRRVLEIKQVLLAAGCVPDTLYHNVPEELDQYDDILSYRPKLESLRQVCRKVIRQHLRNIRTGNLFCLVSKLCLPSLLVKFLLYNQTLDRHCNTES